MKKDDCIFCKLANGDIPVDSIYEDDTLKVIFDASPASKGHILILPKSHAADIYGLEPEQAASIFKTAQKVSVAMKKAFDFDGLNVLQNNGEAAGQTVFHFHMHLIPRYKDDSINIVWNSSVLKDEDRAELKSRIGEFL